MASKQVLSGHVQGAPGRLGTFTSSSQEIHKKKGSTTSGAGGKPVTGWKPTVFDFKSGASTTQCPTCQGTGRIPKGQEDELVALIPYNDKRLKPRRTCLYMSIVIGLLLVSGGVLTAFLYPRNVDVSILVINSSADYINSLSALYSNNNTDIAILEIETTVEIKNANFLPVQVSIMNTTLNNYQSQVGLASTQAFSVASRTSATKTVVQNATFTDGLARRVKTICRSDDWKQFIPIEASVVLSYSYLSHSSDAISSMSHYVDCGSLHSSSPARTIVPPDKVTPTQDWL